MTDAYHAGSALEAEAALLALAKELERTHPGGGEPARGLVETLTVLRESISRDTLLCDVGRANLDELIVSIDLADVHLDRGHLAVQERGTTSARAKCGAA